MKIRSRRGHAVFVVVGLLLVFGAPSLLSDFRLSLLAKYLCFAILAIGVDLSWGYGGMLALGQGVFFGLGGYCMGMYLKLQAAGPTQLPDFMTWSGVDELPALWKPFRHAWFALPMAVLLPMVMAWLLGSLVFRQRVRGAYFAILTQALAVAFVTLLIGQQGLTGGTNGLTNIRELLGLNLRDSGDRHALYLIVVACLGIVFLVARHLMRSRYGRLLVAVRDGEDRVRFLGYDPAKVKTSAFAISAGMAGLAGALFVPVVGIISPALLGVVPSIEMVIWVAVGGRATIYGAALGAVVVNWAKTNLSERYPSGWLYFQGALFVIVMMFAPRGLAGLRSTVGGTVAHLRARLERRERPASSSGGDMIDRAEALT
jgi:urea transport system permease protein